MENHPIPQNVTGFQFKLIGNMTVKQFTYVATGAIMAWIFFSSPLFFLIKFPVAFLFGFTGFSLAFLPIDGRPLDSMLMYFLKALISPNQYLFQKEEKDFLQFTAYVGTVSASQGLATMTKEHLQTLLDAAHKGPKNKLDEKEMISLQNIDAILEAPVAMPYPKKDVPKIIKTPKAEQEKPVRSPTPKEEDFLKEPVKTEPVQQQAQQTVPVPFTVPSEQKINERNAEYQKLLQELTLAKSEKDTLEKELLMLKEIVLQEKELSQQPKIKQPQQFTLKKIIPKPAAKTILPQVPLAPNLIIGIVKDPRGNVLPNILVEVKDAEGNPVRAFKTNAIGQFASATPLPNGTFTIEFDDPTGKQKFDAFQLTLSGEIIAPIETVSQDQREELRRALFTNLQS